MKKEDIIAIAIKYHNMSANERRYGEAKCAFFEQIANNIEDDVSVFVDDENFETEEDVVEFVKEEIDTFDNFYDSEDLENMDMFDDLPEDDDE